MKYRHLMMLQYDFVQQSPPRSGSVCNYNNEQLNGERIVTDSGAIDMKNDTCNTWPARGGGEAKSTREFSGKT